MKRLICLLFCLLLSGCINPLKLFQRADKKVDTIQTQVNKNKDETVEKAKGYVHGTSTALNLDPNPSKYSEVASDLNKRTGLILGPPDYQDALVIDKIVTGLLSTNEQIKIQAQKDLNNKDSQIVVLQNKLKGLEEKLEVAEKKKDEIAFENSSLASKWHKLVTWIKWIFWGGLFVGLFLLVSQVLSAVAPPPYNSAFALVSLLLGGIGKFIFKLFPKTLHFAGVVAKETYDKTEQALTHIVKGVQEIRQTELNSQDITPETKSVKIAEIIDPILKGTMDEATRLKIIEIKAKLGQI